MPCLIPSHERPASPGEGLVICNRCYYRIHRQLDPAWHGDLDATPPEPASIPRLYSLLDPAKRTSGDDGGRRPPGFTSSSPISEHNVSLMDHRSSATARTWHDHAGRQHTEPPGLHHAPSVLHSWAELIADERDARPPTRGIDDTARFLLLHLPYACSRPWIVDMAGELADAQTQLRNAAQDRTGEDRPRPVGTCREEYDGDTCGGQLWVRRGDQVHCRGCGAVWARENWLEGIV